MTDRWQELREAAEASLEEGVLLNGEWRTYGQWPKATQRHIQAAHPQAVLDLLREQDELDARCAALESMFSEPMVAALAEFSRRAQDVAEGVRNYVTCNMLNTDGAVVAFVTIQAADGKNPAEMRDDAIRERDEARAERDRLVARLKHIEQAFSETMGAYESMEAELEAAEAERDRLREEVAALLAEVRRNCPGCLDPTQVCLRPHRG